MVEWSIFGKPIHEWLDRDHPEHGRLFSQASPLHLLFLVANVDLAARKEDLRSLKPLWVAIKRLRTQLDPCGLQAQIFSGSRQQLSTDALGLIYLFIAVGTI